jgi:tetratricopeptide (TPR) repeat protein
MSSRLRAALAYCVLLAGVFFAVSFLACVPDCATAFAQTTRPTTKDISPIQSAAQSLAAGDLKTTETMLNLILQTAPDDFRALNLLGIVRAEQHRDLDAEKLFQHVLELQPHFASAHISLGMLYVQMSKPDDAIPQFQVALKLDPTRSDARASLINVWRDLAHAAVRENDPEKALSFLLQARKISPKDADVQYDFGMVALTMSLLPDAQQAFKEALALKKDDPNTVYALGRAQMALANFEDARATFDRYNQLRPSDASGHYALAMTLEALQLPNDARGQFEKSIELQPAQTESYFQLGRLDTEAGDFQAADKQFNRVLARDPHHAGALAAEGRLKFQQKDYAAAADLLSQAVAADASLREAHYYLGMAYARMNRKEDSDKELALASQLEHEEVEKHQNLIRIIDPDQAVTGEKKK